MTRMTDEDRARFMGALYEQFQNLGTGDKAAIRRVVEPDDLLVNPAFYHLIQAVLGEFKGAELSKVREFSKNLSQMARITYLLPFLKHQTKGKALGNIYAEYAVSERRLFLVMRSEYPQDLVQLRRLCQQFKGEQLDIVKLGVLLYYWGRDKVSSEGSKRQLMKDFYLSAYKDKELAEGVEE